MVSPSRLNLSHARRIASAAASSLRECLVDGECAPAARRRAMSRRRSRKLARFAAAVSIFRRCLSASSVSCRALVAAALRTRKEPNALALARVCSSASSCGEVGVWWGWDPGVCVSRV